MDNKFNLNISKSTKIPFKLFLPTICLIMLSSNLVQSIHGTENATFTDCFNSYSRNDVTTDDKIYTSNLCNFYHEKTGKWFTEQDWNTLEYTNLINKYWPEFYLKYSDQVDRHNQKMIHKNFGNQINSVPSGDSISKSFKISNLTAVGFGGSYNILGKIENISNETFDQIKIIVESYNSSNHLVGVNEGAPIYPSLEPRQVSPFKVYTDVPKSNNDHYVVTVGAAKLGNNVISNETIKPGNSNIESKARTFQDCYSDMALRILIASALTPSSTLSVVDLAEPVMKKFITNSCNFYFEKTGVWIGSPITDDVMTPEIVKEFNQNYNSTFPEVYRKLIQSINDSSIN